MLSKYAVQLLVAVTYVLALPRDNNVGDLKLLKLGSVDASRTSSFLPKGPSPFADLHL